MNKFNEFDIVMNNFNEVGIIREVETHKPWGNQIMIEIVKTNGIFNKLGDVVSEFPENLQVVKKLIF